MSWLDVGLSLFILTHMLLGVGTGFLRGLLGLLGAGAAIVLALAAAPALAGLTPPWLPWPEPVVGWLVLIVAWMIVPRLTMMLAPDLRGQGPGLWDRALGWLPGLAWGLLGAGCFLWLYAAFAGGVPPGHPVASTIHALTGPALQAAAQRLPGLAPAPAQPPGALEQQMLELVNAERKRAGVAPLRWDGRLAEVGRAHSRDMVARDYFDHRSPDGADVADRLRAARLPFLVAGENLAFAGSLAIAHRGLMDSPGHRANILRPQFGRLGVGIVRLRPGAKYTGRRPPRPPGETGRSRAPGPAVDAGPFLGSGGYLIVTQVFAN